MSSLDFDLDTKLTDLELEWRLAYDASMVARAEYQALAANPKGRVGAMDLARERLDRAESRKWHIMAKIERLDDSLLGQG
jgi:hypothetical protein